MRNASESHAGRQRLASHVEVEVEVRDVPSTSYSGAAAPSEETWNARDVVVAYVAARANAGLDTDPRTRAILGKYARKLAQQGGWDRNTVIEAVQRFATSKRHVRFFEEWVATVFNADSLKAHDARKAEEAEWAKTTRGLRGIAAILGGPAVPVVKDGNGSHLYTARDSRART